MGIQQHHAAAHRASYHPGLMQETVLPDAVSQIPIATQPEDTRFLEQFRPMPLSWLVTWLFRPRAEAVRAAQSEPEPFDEHMNGLA